MKWLEYERMPCKEWDGETPLYDLETDTWFFSRDEFFDHCERVGVPLRFQMLVIGEPVYVSEINPYDVLFDGFPGEAELPQEIGDAFETLNESLRAYKKPIYYVEGSYAPTLESLVSLSEREK
jgi:hypothetical protein